MNLDLQRTCVRIVCHFRFHPKRIACWEIPFFHSTGCYEMTCRSGSRKNVSISCRLHRNCHRAILPCVQIVANLPDRSVFRRGGASAGIGFIKGLSEGLLRRSTILS